MTVFTRTWNASYEAIPANGDDASEGALRIRQFKEDTRERLEVDHSMDEDANDGAHKKVTLLEQGSDPTNATNTGFIYTKNDGTLTELYYEDEAGTVTQITKNGALYSQFPSGTQMLFRQTSAPTGWTKDTGSNNHAIKVTSGTVGSGGSIDFLTLFSSGKAVSSESSHIHSFSATSGNQSANVAVGSGGGFAGATPHTHDVSGNTGAGSSHNHTIDLSVRYTDVIIAVKD